MGNETQLRALAHVMVAQSAHALQDKAARDEHLSLALKLQQQRASLETREGTQLLAANWALDDRDAKAAMLWLAQLPSGTARRTLALRIKLKAAQMDNLTLEALDTTRLLAKHHAFSKDVAPSLIKSLVMKRLDDARDIAQLQATWRELDNSDRLQTEVAIHAAYRLNKLNGNIQQTAWNSVSSKGGSLSALESSRLTELIETLEALLKTRDLGWLANVENAQRANPRDPSLQYLAGLACKSHQLWGKAQQQLAQAAPQLQDASLKRRAWCALAELAEQRGEQSVAASAWKNAAQI